ncbi:hypothetical protein C819_04343 [Lachnospiraceae bacterium 10-1]|nr:hypothetical protein C819_04343 [Lachnospiraceae bacterium 10-1]
MSTRDIHDQIQELYGMELSAEMVSEITITKSYQRINGRDVITKPKTAKSKRVITLPDFLVLESEEYVSKLYGMMLHILIYIRTSLVIWMTS